MLAIEASRERAERPFIRSFPRKRETRIRRNLGHERTIQAIESVFRGVVADNQNCTCRARGCRSRFRRRQRRLSLCGIAVVIDR